MEIRFASSNLQSSIHHLQSALLQLQGDKIFNLQSTPLQPQGDKTCYDLLYCN
ncbi:hypothetical protein F383_30872 [Gossypium arboreum]|uniref:Uncharacterized protein n=1 Tax=Gossypium arboreum TaxID=29729 RepID=A0A0B0MER3_GOSAR|nr:hypothetical protein F383_37352 [Gossypium arboreum]KHG24364.1 hypothetical protein F383_30872 [Gossypium arboreum]